MITRFLIVMMVLLLALPVVAQDDAVDPTELELSGTPSEICDSATPAIEPETREYTEASQVLESGVDYRAVMCTSAGAVYIDLFETLTPATVNNFVFLAEENYYNNTIFHRVLEDFMAQAGDPTGTGAGGPGYRFQDEFVSYVTFDRPGLLAMANSGPATNGSQFFITTAETPWLNGAHTIFGEVLEGQAETVDNILLRDPQAGGDATSLDAVVIIRDPELVDSTFEEAETELATAETFVEDIDTFLDTAGVPPDVSFVGAETLETENVVAIAPEELQEDYAAFLEEFGHDYRVSATLENLECNTDYFFYNLTYSVDAFASAADASDALAADFLPSYYESVGYMSVDAELSVPAYVAETDICDTTARIITFDVQRGRYIANVSVIFSVQDASSEQLASFAVSDIPPLFEGGLGEAYRSEVR